MKILILLFTAIVLSGCSAQSRIAVETGADVLISEQLDSIKNRKLGIITNHTGLLKNGVNLVDALKKTDGIQITALFGPEHGIRGDAPDGQSIKDGIDAKTGLKVYSLYGKTRKPIPEMLEDIDLLIFDIQDIGARFYTFISTMYYAIQAAAENGIPIIILDRPNPIGGEKVEGPVLDPDLISFVGIAEIPIRHGMTVGELALFFNRKEILKTEITADLKIIKMKNWKRSYYYDDCGIKWVKPSPNMPDLETAIVYPGNCLLEATNISEGRGTMEPFLKIGAPYINSDDLLDELNKLNIEGCTFTGTEFTPVSIENMSTSPKYLNEKCNGIRIKIVDREKFQAVKFGVNLIHIINKLYPENFSFREKRIDKLWGNSIFREMISGGQAPEAIFKSYRDKLEGFKETRKDFLIY